VNAEIRSEPVRLDARGLPEPAVPATVEGVGALVRWVVQQPLRVPLSRAELQQGYCTRSARQVLAEGTLGFTTPCHDLSAITAVGLERLGLSPTLVLGGIKRPFTAWKFQCGLEVELEGATWVIGFGEGSTYFYAGHFSETRRRPLVIRRRLDEALDPEVSFLTWVDPRGRDALPELVPGYDLQVDLRSHARRQTRLHYAWARRRAHDAARAQREGRLPDASGRWR
jgi:hypothetical protein